MKKFVKLHELKLKKETIAKLTDANMNEIKGGLIQNSVKICLVAETLMNCPIALYGVDPDVE